MTGGLSYEKGRELFRNVKAKKMLVWRNCPELYNKNNELEQERKKNEQQDIRMEKVAEYVRQVLETLRSQIQETNHQLNQSSSAYSVLGRKMEEMELLFASSAYQRSHVFKCRRRKKRVVLRKGASE